MPFILPLATILTAALTYETLKGTKKTIDRRTRRKKRNAKA
ncbi:hypothetical protein [Arcobacter roscoffensis]|nr:hypothetical protein [Arcobacter roscoffensis]